MSEDDYAAYLEKGSVKYKGLDPARARQDLLAADAEGRGRPRLYRLALQRRTIPTRSKASWAAYTARLEKLAKFGD
jgi:hypothetical protein